MISTTDTLFSIENIDQGLIEVYFVENLFEDFLIGFNYGMELISIEHLREDPRGNFYRRALSQSDQLRHLYVVTRVPRRFDVEIEGSDLFVLPIGSLEIPIPIHMSPCMSKACSKEAKW